MKYKDAGQIVSFDLHDDKKATIKLPVGTEYVVYMAAQYIIGEADVEDAIDNPKANYLLYNNWDVLGRSAKVKAERAGIEIYKFSFFPYVLDQLNGLR
ncbi:hypothetical protein [Herbaspirillum huttiense]|uniref:hypothetical protein n=1 Tax=Herbaspirillum huttiense TaxID=863372 RepID=UPI0031E04A1D